MSTSKVTIYYIQESSGEWRWDLNPEINEDNLKYVGEIKNGLPNSNGILTTTGGIRIFDGKREIEKPGENLSLGDKVIHKDNRNLGTGIVKEVFPDDLYTSKFGSIQFSGISKNSLIKVISKEKQNNNFVEILDKHKATVDLKKQRRQEKEEEERILREKKEEEVSKIKSKFNTDYLSSNNYYESECSKFLSKDEYDAEKISFIKKWCEKNDLQIPDDEQARAIGEFGTNIQLIARAGSEKHQPWSPEQHFYKNIAKFMVIKFSS